MGMIAVSVRRPSRPCPALYCCTARKSVAPPQASQNNSHFVNFDDHTARAVGGMCAQASPLARAAKGFGDGVLKARSNHAAERENYRRVAIPEAKGEAVRLVAVWAATAQHGSIIARRVKFAPP